MPLQMLDVGSTRITEQALIQMFPNSLVHEAGGFALTMISKIKC